MKGNRGPASTTTPIAHTIEAHDQGLTQIRRKGFGCTLPALTQLGVPSVVKARP